MGLILGHKDPLEQEMATHSSFLAWKLSMNGGTRWATARGFTESAVTGQPSRQEANMLPAFSLTLGQLFCWSRLLPLLHFKGSETSVYHALPGYHTYYYLFTWYPRVSAASQTYLSCPHHGAATHPPCYSPTSITTRRLSCWYTCMRGPI